MENQDVRDVVEKLDVLYSMVSEAWGVPLGNDKCIIEREKALDIIREGRGSHFDPSVVDAFLHAENEIRRVAQEQSDQA